MNDSAGYSRPNRPRCSAAVGAHPRTPSIRRGSKPKGSSSRWARIRSSSESRSRVAPVGDDHAVGQHHRPRAQLQGVGQVVGDHQHGDVQRAQDVGQLPPRRPGRGWRTARRARGSRAAWPAPSPPPPAAAGRTTGGAAGRSAKSAMPTWSSAAGTRRSSSVAAQAGVGRPERHVLADGRHEQLVVGVLEDDADPATDLRQVRFATGSPLTVDRAGAGGEDAVQVQHQGGLAGAVGPEQGDPLTAVRRAGRRRTAPGGRRDRRRRGRVRRGSAGGHRPAASVAVGARRRDEHRARCTRLAASSSGPA